MKVSLYDFIFATLLTVVLCLTNFSYKNWEGWLIMLCAVGLSVCGYKQGKAKK